jgi:hypothetical protein
MDDTTLLLLLIPLVVIQVSLAIYALIDLYRRGGARPPLPTWAWVLIIALGELLGPVLYFIFGRKEDALDDERD